ncbi:MAG: acyl-CoA thioesterase/BAAT N-terminal domain-containing protein [Deinococcota bacterium]|nr:acyl-CoA thioesterase/BAAT N-terminal domain-containing protein [Deinococcota bacterium]
MKTLLLLILTFSAHQFATAQEIILEPQSALGDTPVTITLSGFEAGSEVTLRARMADETDLLWASYATFEVAEDGTVEPASQAPLEGTYVEADPMGLFWSMQPEGEPEAGFFLSSLEPWVVTLGAEVSGETVATAAAERLAVAPEVTRTEVRDEGLVGTLFTPPGDGPHPTVIVLGGSEGGLDEGWAALLASRGYAVLALAYFGVDELPEELIEVPLETFYTALNWLAAQDAVDEGRIVLVGASKGGEAALLVASRRPEVRAVVAYVPSNVVWQGISFTDFTPRSSWSLAGEGLPFVPYAAMPETLPDDPETMVLEPLYRESLERYEGDEAVIPVEDIGGPVLLISGGDDALWPSTLMAERALERLEGHDRPLEHLEYEEAGHLILNPYVPTWGTEAILGLAMGGTAQANAEAAADSWPRVLDFLEENLLEENLR